MKLMISLFVFALTCAAQAAPVLSCKSYDVIEGWDGGPTRDAVLYTAYIESDTQLRDAVVKGAYLSDVRNVEADPNYRPKAKSYQDYNRFQSLEDAWNWFLILLPKDLTKKRGAFTGYLQVFTEEGFGQTISMRCFVIR